MKMRCNHVINHDSRSACLIFRKLYKKKQSEPAKTNRIPKLTEMFFSFPDTIEETFAKMELTLFSYA